MKKIELSKGRFTTVDDEDYQWLSQYKWWYSGKYAVRCRYDGKKRINIWMHREIIKAPNSLFVDHINANKIDNRKSNLRLCTKSQNGFNRPAQKNNKLGHKNIYLDKKRQKWSVEIRIQGKKYYLGRFNNLEDAKEIRDKTIKGLIGEFAHAD